MHKKEIMKETNHIIYLRRKPDDLELIVCRNSVISYPLHNHISVFTVGLVLYGSVSLTVGDDSFLCEKDSSFTIPPYIPHMIEAKTPYSLLTLCIGKNALHRRSKDKLKQHILHLLTSVCELELTEIQTARLSDCLDFSGNALLSSPSESSIDPLKKQIELCPQRKVSIDEMARSLYLSKYHMIRSFKQAVGLTPHQFQIQNRIRKAQRMLNDVDNITEVALTTGFCDQSHFIKQFEKYVGLTPTAYKTSCRLLT